MASKILVAEDDQFILKAMTTKLTKEGFEVLKEVKGDQRLKNIPILIASNLGQENDIQQVLDLGATDYLIKSEFTLESLVQKIKNILK